MAVGDITPNHDMVVTAVKKLKFLAKEFTFRTPRKSPNR